MAESSKRWGSPDGSDISTSSPTAKPPDSAWDLLSATCWPWGAVPSRTVKLDTGLGPPHDAVNTGGPNGRFTSPSSRIE